MNLWKYIKDRMMQNHLQLICEKDKSFNYTEVTNIVEEFAKKISHEKCCAVICSSELYSAMALLSCFAAGVTAAPISMRYGENICNKILDKIKPTAIITDIAGILCKIQYNGGYIVPEKHPALIMCTSGTSGSPKGVMLSEQNIYTNVTDIAEYFDIETNDSILISRPLYHSAVLTGEFLLSLSKGVKIVFDSESFNPQSLWASIKKNNITTFCGTPTILSLMARFKKRASTLKTICISGECLSAHDGKQIAEAFPEAKIFHVYGLTEASPRVCYLPSEYFNEYPDSVGLPLKSVKVKLLNRSGEEAQINEDALLYVKGENIMLGYYNNPELTKRTLQNGWLYTGDIASINSKGFIKIKGRNDDLIIRAGMNIYPQEIEGIVRSDPRVKEVYVYSYKDRHNIEQLGMKIAGDFKNADEVISLCIELLPGFQIPSSVELIKELPKNGSGKIIRGKNNA